jgi:hypothetical protein
MGFIIENRAGEFHLTLDYRANKEAMSLPVPIQTTSPYFGGVRYWGTCPNCGRRVGKLHVPAGGKRFACRLCLNLTYRSAQKAHNLDSVYHFVDSFMQKHGGSR